MRNVMLRWNSVVCSFIIFIAGFSSISEIWAKKISSLETWDHSNTDQPSGEWQPMLIDRSSTNEDQSYRNALHYHLSNEQPDQILRKKYQLAQTQVFPPSAINLDNQIPERKSFHLSSISSPNRLESLVAPTILGAFNSIGLRMVQNRIPAEKNIKINPAAKQSLTAHYGQPSSKFHQFLSPPQSSGANTFFNKQESFPNVKYQPSPARNSLSSVQAFPPGRQNLFLTEYYQQAPQKQESNFDSDTLSSRKQVHHSSFLTDNNIPTIYGTRDTFNLPTIYKPHPFTKNPQFEEYTYQNVDNDADYRMEDTTGRNPYKDRNIAPDEKSPGKQVFDQLSKYGRPFAVPVDNRIKEPNYNNKQFAQETYNPYPTVKSGKFAINTHYKGDKPASIANHRLQSGMVNQYQNFPQYVNLEVHSSPIAFSESPTAQSEEEESSSQNGLGNEQFVRKPYPTGNGVRIRNWDINNGYKSITRPSVTSSPFLPTPSGDRDRERDNFGDKEPSPTSSVEYDTQSSIPANHKYANEQYEYNQVTTTRKGNGYRRTRPTSATLSYSISNPNDEPDTSTTGTRYADTEQEPYTERGTTINRKNPNRKNRPFAVNQDELKVSSTTTASSPNLNPDVPYHNINDAFYDSDTSDYYHRQSNKKPTQYHSKFTKPPNNLSEEQKGQFSTISNDYPNYPNQYSDGYLEGQAFSGEVAEIAAPQESTTSSTTPTTTTTTTSTTTEYPSTVARPKSKGKYSNNSTRPKFSIKDYKTRSTTTTSITSTATTTTPVIEEDEKKPILRKSSSRLKSNSNNNNNNNHEETDNEQQIETGTDQPPVVRKYKPRPKAGPSRYRTTSTTTINPLLESTTTERVNTFRPTGASRYKSSGGRNYSKYRTTTEASNELLLPLEDAVQSSSVKHTVKSKPLFSAKRSNHLLRPGSTNSTVLPKESSSEQHTEGKSSVIQGESKTVFPKKNLPKFKDTVKATAKSDDESDIKIMTSSEEIIEKKSAPREVDSEHVVVVNDDAGDNEDSSEDSTTMLASGSELFERVISVVEPDDREPNNNMSPYEIEMTLTTSPTTELQGRFENVNKQPSSSSHIRSSSLSTDHQSSFVTNDSRPPVDAYFRSWMEAEKRKNL